MAAMPMAKQQVDNCGVANGDWAYVQVVAWH